MQGGFPQTCVSQPDGRQDEYRTYLFGLQEKRNGNGALFDFYPRTVSKFVGPRKGHLCRHISKAFGIDPYGEEAQYLSGYVGQKMFPVAKKFLCEHCRKGMENNNRTEAFFDFWELLLKIIRDMICKYVDLSLNLHHEEGDSYTKRG